MWILWKMRFRKFEFLDKLWIFAPVSKWDILRAIFKHCEMRHFWSNFPTLWTWKSYDWKVFCTTLFPPARGLFATRHCLANGTWELTDFSPCIEPLVPSPEELWMEFIKKIARMIQFSGSIISLTLLLVSFYIFLAFR